MAKEKYPLTFKKCPACGHEETVADQVATEERAKGRMGDDFHPCLMESTMVIADPRKLPLLLNVPIVKVPVIRIMLDVCTSCGCVYCIRAALPQKPVFSRSFRATGSFASKVQKVGSRAL